MRVRGRLRALVVVGVVAVVAVTVGGAWWLGGRHVLQSLTIQEVSADVAARAMQDDHFYSDFADKVLVVHGTVASAAIQQPGAQIVLQTNSALTVHCLATGNAPLPLPGDRVSLLVVGANAQREPSAVVFPSCRLVA